MAFQPVPVRLSEKGLPHTQAHQLPLGEILMTTIAQTLAPLTATCSFMMTPRNDKFRYDGQLCIDVYAARSSYAWDANPFTVLTNAGVDYESMKPLVLVSGMGEKVTERHVFGVDSDLPFARLSDEPIFQWLDRVMLLPQARGVSVVIPADRLTAEQVQHLFNTLSKPKYQAETTAKCVSMFRTPTPDTPAELVARQKFAAPIVPAPSVAIDHANVAPPITRQPVEPIVRQSESQATEIPTLTTKDYKALYLENLGIKAPNIKVEHLGILYAALLTQKNAGV
jgi:hypothetical protein